MQAQTLNDIFFTIVERKSERVLLTRAATGWSPISSQEFYRNVAGVARAFSHWDIGKGDRVAILSENRPEWAITDFASLLLGAVVVPIYSTLTPQQTAHILSDSGASLIAVSTQEQLKKVLSIKHQTAVKKILVMDPVETAEAVPMQPLMEKGPSGRDSELDHHARMITPDDLASIIYTSGTTGTPKGVQLTHRNLTSNIMNPSRVLEFTPDKPASRSYHSRMSQPDMPILPCSTGV